MRLSVMGLAFGALVARGDFATPEEAQRWLDYALREAAWWPSCLNQDIEPYSVTPRWPKVA